MPFKMLFRKSDVTESGDALRAEIAKWEAIVQGTGRDDGPVNSPLCIAFLKSDDTCFGCPVQKRTGRHSCDGTPYEAWTAALKPEDVKKAAKAELEFLKSLLPQPADRIEVNGRRWPTPAP